MPYIVLMRNIYTGETEQLEDETYETYEDAEFARDNQASDFSAGADVLELAGESYDDPEDYEFEIEEID